MTFHFKQKSHDFFVSENLPYKLTGKGDAFYVYVEKRNMTTYDVLDHLRSKLWLSRMSLGIAGLKDKKAVAKQWISIYDRALKQAGGELVFIDALSEVVKVLDTGRHPFPMNMSTSITNSFQIKLRSTKKLGQDEKAQALEIVKGLLKNGYTNLFGEQRFGINGRNATQGREIMTGNTKEKFEKGEAIFKLQAYASKLFNEYASKRAKNKKVLDGDIVARRENKALQYGVYKAETKMVRSCVLKNEKNTDFFFYPKGVGDAFPYDAEKMVVTWPVPGYNMPMPILQSVVGQQETAFLAKNDLDPKTMKKYQDYAVYGLRRPMWVFPTQTGARYVGDDMLVDFTLPAGSYASIVVDELMRKVG